MGKSISFSSLLGRRQGTRGGTQFLKNNTVVSLSDPQDELAFFEQSEFAEHL